MTWAGAQLYKSLDASTYEAVLSTTSSAVIGISQDILGDFAGGNVFDYENEVTITLQTTGTLTSYTELQVLNGFGAFILGAPGRWEVIQFKTATLVSTGVYTLSGLLRGRRGTEWAQGLHQVGDKFVLANVGTWQRPNPGTAEIGLSRYFKAVTFRDSLTNTSSQLFTNTGVGLKPFAPVQLTGARDGSNNLTINWIRRSRIGGEWRDYVDTQVGEASLSFDIEVWNSDYSTLLRTIPSVADVTTTYSATNQTADGITPGDPVYLRIYQISATIGRGYKLEGSV